MDDKQANTHQDSDQLTITLDPKNPIPWKQVVERIQSFLSRRSNPPTGRRYGSNLLPIGSSSSSSLSRPSSSRSSLRRAPSRSRNIRFTTPSRLRSILSSSRKSPSIEMLLNDLPRESSSRPSSSRNSSPIIAPPETRKRLTSPLLSLPLELFFMIFDLATEPHEVKVVAYTQLVKSDGKYPFNPLIHKPSRYHKRKLLNLFHISKAFRQIAISRYGQPNMITPLFNPQQDKLVLKVVWAQWKPLVSPLIYLFLQRVRYLELHPRNYTSGNSFKFDTFFRHLSTLMPVLRTLEIPVDSHIPYHLHPRMPAIKRLFDGLCVDSDDASRSSDSPRIFPQLEILRVF